MNKAIRVVNLSEYDRKQLQLLLSSDNKSLAKRARIILLSAEGKSLRRIADEVALHYQNVRKWVHRFISEGFSGLEHRGKGKTKNIKHSADIKQRIAAIAATHPRDLHQPFDTWSLPKLRKYLISKKIVPHISIETIRKVLIANNIDWKKGDYWLRIADQGKQHAEGSVMVNLRDSSYGNGGVTISFDRQGYAAISEGSPNLGENTELVSEQNLRDVSELHAFYAPQTGEIRIRFYRKR